MTELTHNFTGRQKLFLGTVLLIALFSASMSGPIVRFARAHFLSIAFYRNFLAFLGLAILLMPRILSAKNRNSFIAVYDLHTFFWNLCGGAIFGIHLILWIAAVQHTTVANAALCFSINPLITTFLAGFFFSEKATGWLWFSMFFGLAGIFSIGFYDLSAAPEYLPGDLLGLLSGLAFSCYILVGRKVRAGKKPVPTEFYMMVLYLGAFIVAGAGVFITGAPLSGFDTVTWLAFLGLIIFPTLLGHGLFNYLLRYLEASFISTATLSEPLFAGLVAYFFFDEAITAGAATGYALILVSMLFLTETLSGKTARPASSEMESWKHRNEKSR